MQDQNTVSNSKIEKNVNSVGLQDSAVCVIITDPVYVHSSSFYDSIGRRYIYIPSLTQSTQWSLMVTRMGAQAWRGVAGWAGRYRGGGVFSGLERLGPYSHHEQQAKLCLIQNILIGGTPTAHTGQTCCLGFWFVRCIVTRDDKSYVALIWFARRCAGGVSDGCLRYAAPTQPLVDPRNTARLGPNA